MPDPYAVTEYVVEGLVAGGSWRTFATTRDEARARDEYERWRQSRKRNRGKSRFRIVKRTIVGTPHDNVNEAEIVITDEVIEEENPG